MTKAELIASIAKDAGLSKKDSEAAMDAAVEAIKKSVKKEGSFRVSGTRNFHPEKKESARRY